MAVSPGRYVIAEHYVEVRGSITHEQYMEVLRLAGREADRFNSWCNHFVIEVPTDRVLAPVLAYLREQGLPHSFTVDRAWRPGCDEPARATPGA